MAFDPLATWEKVADDWDKMMGSDGNDYWKVIELPVLERMVETKAGERALDLATGNGLVARWLRRGGADVIATDGSLAMVEAAKRRDGETSSGHDDGGSVSYRVLNVTDPQAFDGFANAELSTGGPFDIITMNMAIMDVPTIEPLARILPTLLKKDTGRFVATLLHPLFTCGATRSIEYEDNPQSGKEEILYTMKLKKYLHVSPVTGVAMQHQAVHQVFYHRPLQELFSCFLQAGLVIDALEEPNFDEQYVRENSLELGSLRQLTQFPKILAFRLRVAGR